MRLELLWGKVRRSWLRTFRPGYVQKMAVLRQGECPGCPHQIVDPRDLKFFRNVCGYWFRAEDDPFRWRDRLSLTRIGFCEILLITAFSLALAAGLCFLWFLGWPPWLIALLFGVLILVWLQSLLFFRDPERTIPAEENALVSPADGTVTHVGEVEEPDFPGGRAFRISIFLSIFDVHVNRVPRTGRVTRLQYFPGRYLSALKAESARENEQLWIDLAEAGSERPLRVKQISGLIARRIVCWLREGQVVRKGDRFGMIKFGSRTEIYVPAGLDLECDVKVGDKVRGGSTILLHYK